MPQTVGRCLIVVFLCVSFWTSSTLIVTAQTTKNSEIPESAEATNTKNATEAAQRHYRLSFGDDSEGEALMQLQLDSLVSTQTGITLSWPEWVKAVSDTDILFIGEGHTDVESHRLQWLAIRHLHEAGRNVIIGLEMFTVDEQAQLDRWLEGQTEADFVPAWYKAWGFHWNYYRDIFLYAQKQGIPLRALNIPRKVIREVRMKGFDGVEPPLKEYLPPSIRPTDEAQLKLFKSHFDEEDPMHSGMSDEHWQSMLDAQSTWDAAMGYHATQALQTLQKSRTSKKKAKQSKKPIVVVLIGSGHVAYGLGIEYQAKHYASVNTASMVAIAVEDEDGNPMRIRPNYADYVMGTPRQVYEPYPTLGVSSIKKENGNRSVIWIAEGSPAEQAGLQLGDELVKVEGRAVSESGAMALALADKQWGESVTVELIREGERHMIDVALKRSLPK